MGDPCCQHQNVNYVTKQIKSLAPLHKQLPLKNRGVIAKPSLFPGEKCWLAAKGGGVWFGPRSRSRPSRSNKAALGSYEGGGCVLCPAGLAFPPLSPMYLRIGLASILAHVKISMPQVLPRRVPLAGVFHLLVACYLPFCLPTLISSESPVSFWFNFKPFCCWIRYQQQFAPFLLSYEFSISF